MRKEYPVRCTPRPGKIILGGDEDVEFEIDMYLYGVKKFKTRSSSDLYRALLQLNSCSWSADTIQESMPPYDVVAWVNQFGLVRRVSSINGKRTIQPKLIIELFSSEEMKSLMPFDVNSYLLCMREIQLRMEAAGDILYNSINPKLEIHAELQRSGMETRSKLDTFKNKNDLFIHIEHLMLHVRKSCELIHVACLTARTHIIKKVRNEWNFRSIESILKQIDKNYWMRPVVIKEDGNSVGIGDTPEWFINDISNIYDTACDWVHCATPYNEYDSIYMVFDACMKFLDKVIQFIRNHAYVHSDGSIMLVKIRFEKDYLVEIKEFSVEAGGKCKLISTLSDIGYPWN